MCTCVHRRTYHTYTKRLLWSWLVLVVIHLLLKWRNTLGMCVCTFTYVCTSTLIDSLFSYSRIPPFLGSPISYPILHTLPLPIHARLATVDLHEVIWPPQLLLLHIPPRVLYLELWSPRDTQETSRRNTWSANKKKKEYEYYVSHNITSFPQRRVCVHKELLGDY